MSDGLRIVGGTVVDGTGRDPVAASVAVLGDRIVEVGKADGGGTVVDVAGLHVLPGLIDAHTHLGLVAPFQEDTTPAAVVAGHLFRNLERMLDAGFTTARDVGGVDGGIVRAMDLGLVRGPRVIPAGALLCQTGGHTDWRPCWVAHPGAFFAGTPGLVRTSVAVDGADAVRHAARVNFQRGARFLKVAVSGGVGSLYDDLEDTQLSRDELVAAVEEARARRTYVTAHAHGSDAIRFALEAGVTCIEHGSFLDAGTAELMARVGAGFVPTMATVETFHQSAAETGGLPDEVVRRIELVGDSLRRATKLAFDAGVAVGSGSDLFGPEQRRWGLEIVLKAAVLGPMEAIRSATAVNAAVIGEGHDLGTLEAGKRADIVAVDGDPLAEPELFDDPARVRLVVKDGRIVKDTR